MNALLDFLQGASNSAAANVSAPVDGLAWLLRKAGVNVGDAPMGGSDWMRSKGLTVDPKNKLAGLLGESFGGVAPILAAAKAPQIAQGLLQMGENAAIPQKLNRQTGMALFDTTGLPNKGRDLVQAKAQALADQLQSNGFKVDLQHSGSAAGPSSYLKVFDPQTGRYFDDVRLSGHSKGAFNSAGVMNVASDEEFAKVIEKAMQMRSMGKSSGITYQENLEKLAQEFISNGVKPKSAYTQARIKLEAK